MRSVFAHALGGGRLGERVLVALRLKPGCRERARELLLAGPPFEPRATALVLHDAFLLENEVLFLFGIQAVGDLEPLDLPDFARPVEAWGAIMAGNLCVAECVYTWHRPQPALTIPGHLGLGL